MSENQDNCFIWRHEPSGSFVIGVLDVSRRAGVNKGPVEAQGEGEGRGGGGRGAGSVLLNVVLRHALK